LKFLIYVVQTMNNFNFNEVVVPSKDAPLKKDGLFLRSSENLTKREVPKAPHTARSTSGKMTREEKRSTSDKNLPAQNPPEEPSPPTDSAKLHRAASTVGDSNKKVTTKRMSLLPFGISSPLPKSQ